MSFLPFHSLSDTVFFSILNEDNLHNFPLNVRDTLTYNPLKPNDTLSVDDPLTSSFRKEFDCNYYFCDDQGIKQSTSQLSLNILSCNISSVPLYLESLFDQCLLFIDVKFDIIGLCETRLSDDICQLYNESNYNPYFRNEYRSRRSGRLFT